MSISKGKTALIAVVTTLSSVGFAQGIAVNIDGHPVNFSDTTPREVNGRVLVPLRGVFENLGANVDWNSSTQTVDANKGDTSVRLQIGNSMATVNGKNVYLDVPPRIIGGSTMVPLRFVSESLGADVDWQAQNRTVFITTAEAMNNPNYVRRNTERRIVRRQERREQREVRRQRNTLRTALRANSVIPVSLDDPLSSSESRSGDRFSATLRTEGQNEYAGLPQGTRIEGHVVMARPRSGNEPGVLQLAFDRVRLPDGYTEKIDGTVTGLDANSITRGDNGILQAKNGARKKGDTMVYVGYGAGAGALLGILTKNNILTTTVVGGALGLLVDQLQKNQRQPRDVNLSTGTQMGVRLEQPLEFER